MKYSFTSPPLWIENQSELSLNLGRAYAIAYADDRNSTQTQELFEMYKSSRRAIPKNERGYRYGAYDAYLSRDSFIGV